MHVSSSSSRSSWSNLITFSIVCFSKFSIIPWILTYLRSRKYESWAQVTILYGLLLSTLRFGEIVGKMFASQFTHLSPLYIIALFFSLSSSYISLTLVSRFFVIFLLFFNLGFTGSVLTTFSLHFDSLPPRSSALVTSQSPSASPSSLSAEFDTEVTLICFIFSTLCAAFMYDHGTSPDHPAWWMAAVWGVGMAGLGVVYVFYHLCIKKKSKKVGSGVGGIAAGGTGEGEMDDSAQLDADGGKDNEDTPPPGVDPLIPPPPNFLSTCQQDAQKARRMYFKMLRWRARTRMDNIKSVRQAPFFDILPNYPHFVWGYSFDGCAVCYELLGRGNARALRAVLGSMDELVTHFNLRNEYVFQDMLGADRRKEVAAKFGPDVVSFSQQELDGVPRLMTVIDVQGIGMSSITTDVLSFIQKSGEVIDNYYPEQVKRLVVINAPRWFSLIWQAIAPVLPRNVQNKIDICYDAKGLDKYIHARMRPNSYGGQGGDVQQAAADASDSRQVVYSKYIGGGGRDMQGFIDIALAWDSKANDAAAIAVSENRKESVPSNTKENDSKKADSKDSMFGWLKKRFTSAPTPSAAYLGEKNIYRFNVQSGRWELDDDSADSENPPPPVPFPNSPVQSSGLKPRGRNSRALGQQHSKSTGQLSSPPSPLPSSDLEEHGLVLAIQAAHMAKGGLHRSHSHFNVMENTLEGGDAYTLPTQYDLDTMPPSSLSTAPPLAPPSPTLFLLTILVFLLGASPPLLLQTLLPLTLTSPLTRGGGGWGVRDLGLLLSCGATLCYVMLVAWGWGRGGARLVQASPVRGLRVGAGGVVFFSLALALTLHYLVLPIEDVLHHYEVGRDAGSRRSDGGGDMSFLYPHLQLLLPSLSLPSLLLPSLLAAFLYMSACLARAASVSLLELSLRATFPPSAGNATTVSQAFNPTTYIAQTLLSLVDLSLPFVSSLVFSIFHAHKIRYPLDDTHPLHMLICTSLFLYCISLFLTVSFRGDFGTLSDEVQGLGIWASKPSPVSVSLTPTSTPPPTPSSLGARARKGVGGFGAGAGGFNADDSDKALGRAIEEEGGFLSLPLGDIHVLVASLRGGYRHSAYGTRLYGGKDL